MIMKEMFEVASGSIAGREHVSSGRNNQDARNFLNGDRAVIAVVCDGCSGGENSGRHSEVGAKIGARLVVESISRRIEAADSTSPLLSESAVSNLLEYVRQDVLAELRVLALAMGGSLSQTVNDYFLFTVFGALITQEASVLFSVGDGVFFVNGEMLKVGPFPANEPPYLAYGGLVDSSLGEIHPELTRFQVHGIIPTGDVQSILIGSDGVNDLVNVAERRMPGKEEIVGPISQLWEEDRYFKNFDMIRRKLARINRESIRANWEEGRVVREVGLLPDDTTIVVIRRRKAFGEG